MAKAIICEKCGSSVESASSPDLGCMVCMLHLASGNLPAPSDRDSPLQQFAQYVIEKREDGRAWELGRGAMGVTYRATDSTLQRSIALKITNIDHAPNATTARERFLREARAAAALRHPNIATVHQFGIDEESGQCFYAMELIEGETLEERVRRKGPCDVPTVIAIAQQVAGALLAAETRGLVHRDIKPGNLMIIDDINSNPIVKIIDFGLAKALTAPIDPASATSMGFVGTPAFASPEQLGQKHLDIRSDVYSLGLTLWFALTGRTPFAGHTTDELRRARAEPLPLDQIKSIGIPKCLRVLLGSMLSLEPAARPGTASLSFRIARCRTHARRKLTAAAIAGILGIGSFLTFWIHSHPAATVAVEPSSIAVLPFEDFSADNSKSFFTDGLQEDVLVSLSKIAELRVISRNSIMSYRGTARDLREIGRALGVNAILEGTVRRDGMRAHINTQLIRAGDGSQIWAENYDDDISNAFALQRTIATQIASALRVKLSKLESNRLEQPPTSNREAYLRFVEAKNYYEDYRRLRPDLEKAEQLYQEAINLDPNFALAYARLAQVESMYHEMYDPTPERREKARAAAREALRLQPDLPEAHMAVGLDYWRANIATGTIDYQKALDEFAIAQLGLPNDAEICGLIGQLKRHQGQWGDSTAQFYRATVLDPNSIERWHRLFYNYELTHNYGAADHALDRVIALAPPLSKWRYNLQRADLYYWWKGDLDRFAHLASPPEPDPAGPHTEELFSVAVILRHFDEAEQLLLRDSREVFSYGFLYGAPKALLLAQVYSYKGEVTRAGTALNEASALLEGTLKSKPQDADVRMFLAETYARLGRKDDALREAQRAVGTIPTDRDAYLGARLEARLSEIYVLLGEIEKAIPLVQRSLTTPNGLFLNEVRLHPFWDAARQNRRFAELLTSPDTVIPVKQ